MLGIGCALICLLLAGINDFVFKLFANKARSKGLFVFLIGLIWLLTLLPLPHGAEMNWHMTLLWGSVSGLFSVAGNLLLIEGMARQSAGGCSLIYRLNLVPVVLGAALFLDEMPTPCQYAAIACAIAAIVLFQNRAELSSRYAIGGILLVVCAALLRAGMGLSYKYGFLHGADKNAVAQLNSLFWIIGGLLYALWRERTMLKINRKLCGYGLLSGILVAGIILFMAWSLFYGAAIVVLPIAQMSFIVTFLLGVIVLKEPATKCKIASLACGVLAVILLSIS